MMKKPCMRLMKVRLRPPNQNNSKEIVQSSLKLQSRWKVLRVLRPNIIASKSLVATDYRSQVKQSKEYCKDLPKPVAVPTAHRDNDKGNQCCFQRLPSRFMISALYYPQAGSRAENRSRGRLGIDVCALFPWLPCCGSRDDTSYLQLQRKHVDAFIIT